MSRAITDQPHSSQLSEGHALVAQVLESYDETVLLHNTLSHYWFRNELRELKLVNLGLGSLLDKTLGSDAFESFRSVRWKVETAALSWDYDEVEREFQLIKEAFDEEELVEEFPSSFPSTVGSGLSILDVKGQAGPTWSSSVAAFRGWPTGHPFSGITHDMYPTDMPSATQIYDTYSTGMSSVTRTYNEYSTGMPSVTRTYNEYSTGMQSVTRRYGESQDNPSSVTRTEGQHSRSPIAVSGSHQRAQFVSAPELLSKYFTSCIAQCAFEELHIGMMPGANFPEIDRLLPKTHRVSQAIRNSYSTTATTDTIGYLDVDDVQIESILRRLSDALPPEEQRACDRMNDAASATRVALVLRILDVFSKESCRIVILYIFLHTEREVKTLQKEFRKIYCYAGGKEGYYELECIASWPSHADGMGSYLLRFWPRPRTE